MIIPNTDQSYSKLLETLLEAHSWQSPLHTQSAFHFYCQLLDDGMHVDDRSFILLWEGEPVIGFRGVAVISDIKTDLVIREVPCIALENKPKLTAKAAKTFCKEFDRFTEDVNGSIRYRDFIIGGVLTSLSVHLLQKGAIAKPIFSQVIDLKDEKSVQKSSIRKSYKSLINWGIRELDPRVYDAATITWELIDQFRQLHIRESGRETRSEESWRRQLHMVQAGEAFIVLGHFNGELVSSGFFMYNKTNCYYGSSASRRDLFDKPLFHAIMWTAILHVKELGCRWFEVGEQLYPNHLSEKPPTKKELGISEFKAGFGGKTRMLLDLTLNCS